MSNETHVEYNALYNVEDGYPTFVNELKALLPANATWEHFGDPYNGKYDYWQIVQDGEEMIVLYDDCASIEYVEGTPWGDTVVAVLDFMDKVAMQLFGEPAREQDEDE
jgi:hypothetical protein